MSHQEHVDNLTKFLAGLFENGQVPGIFVLVHKDGKNVYSHAEGWADVERQTPLTETTLYRAYSMTKPITSVAAMMLVEQGLIGLDDDIGEHIPEWDTSSLTVLGNDSIKPKVTVRHLLTHTSGLTYGFWHESVSATSAALRQQRLELPSQISVHTDADPNYSFPANLADFTKRVSQIPLLFPPGSEFHYSNSTDILGRLVECVSQVPFDQFLKQHIFDPLGMTDTQFGVPADKLPRLASCYIPNNPSSTYSLGFVPKSGFQLRYDGQDPTSWCTLPPSSPSPPSHQCPSGGAGLISSAADYIRFADAVTLAPSPLLSQSTLALMRQDHLKPLGAERKNLAYMYPLGFGLGFSVGGAGREQDANAGGWAGAAGTYFYSDVQNRLSVVLVLQYLEYHTIVPNVRSDVVKLVHAAFADHQDVSAVDDVGAVKEQGFTG
eukprot:c9928_g1_i1.p1 GENE.c9928_g1_i1~~c9928_g1_i1.p1  ORF type:complete len:446 (+),score=100.04 c9928_g1_i1:33-1340(+)